MRRIGEHAVVIGGSVAGLLAARALTEAYDRVTVIDRDALPDGVAGRRAVPQGRHAHALLPLGQRCLEQLLPGAVGELVADGAASCAALEEYRFVLSGSRLAPVSTGNRTVFASRPFIEGHVRARVRALPGVALRDRCDVLGLIADGPRVTGVRILRRAPGSAEERLAADLVVAAGGRAARVPAWLEQLGWERPDEDRLDVDVAYASRFVRLPEARWATSGCCSSPRRPSGRARSTCSPRRAAATSSRSAATAPPTGRRPTPRRSWRSRARSRRPTCRMCSPRRSRSSDVATHAFPVSVRRRYERLARFPDGLLVCGDAIASFNPTYGQGMSVAAAEAVTLRDCLAAGERGLARRFFTATARGACGDAWDLATGSDLALPQVAGPRPVRVRVLNAYLRRLRAAAVDDHAVAGALIAVVGLVEQPRTLLAPGIVRRVARSPRARPAPALPLRRGTLRIGGVTTPLREAGPADAAEAVVFLHGNPGSGADWEPLLATAGAHGHRAIAWDAPGFGSAGGRLPPDRRRPRRVHRRGARRARGRARPPRAARLRWPWGLRWAVGEPERFASAVLLNTGALPGYRWHALARVWRARGLGEAFNATTTRAGFRMLMRRGQRTPLPAAFVDRMYDDFDRGTRRAVLELYRSVADVAESGRRLSALLAPLDRPALVLWGDGDPYIGVEHAERQRLAFPRAAGRIDEALALLDGQGCSTPARCRRPRAASPMPTGSRCPSCCSARPPTATRSTGRSSAPTAPGPISRPISPTTWTSSAAASPPMVDVWGADHGGYVKRMQAAVRAVTEERGLARRPALPAGQPARRRQADEDEQAGRADRHPARRGRRGRPRRRPLHHADPQERRAARFRPGQGHRAVEGQPGLLRPVRPRADLLGVPQRGARRAVEPPTDADLARSRPARRPGRAGAAARDGVLPARGRGCGAAFRAAPGRVLPAGPRQRVPRAVDTRQGGAEPAVPDCRRARADAGAAGDARGGARASSRPGSA